MLAHKDPMFLMPVIPFCFLMLGYFLAKQIKASKSAYRRKLIFGYILFAAIVELSVGAFY